MSAADGNTFHFLLFFIYYYLNIKRQETKLKMRINEVVPLKTLGGTIAVIYLQWKSPYSGCTRHIIVFVVYNPTQLGAL